MPYFDDIHIAVHKAFGQARPEVARICDEIADYLSAGPAASKFHLTLSLLRRETRPLTDSDLLMAIQYLTGGDNQLLETQFEYAADTGEFFPLTRAQVAQGADAVAAYLGVSFTSAEDFESQVMIYFVPSRFAQDAMREMETA